MSNSARKEVPALSKSRFMAGLQCHKRLYLECYHRELADPVSEGQQAVFDTGTNIGELARMLYPGGLLIAEDYLHHEEAMQTTERALPNTKVPALFEAAFRYDDIRIRADILVRADDGRFDLIEVKSSTQVKDEYIPDIAVQLYVLNGCGVQVRRACLGHINREYVYPGGEYDLHQLFTVDDVTDRALTYLAEVPGLLAGMRQPLLDAEPPDIKIGKQCAKPYVCQFFGHCHVDLPEHHVSRLPRISDNLLAAFEEMGIDDIRDIPADFTGLSVVQQRIRDCVVNDHVHLDGELAERLQELDHPIHFLDFETFNPALPLYPGTRPYDIIPFQWSDHILDEQGQLRHEEFLFDDPGDPREPFTTSLLETLGTRGSIVVYSSFEASRMRELAAAFPALADDLSTLIDTRIVDLLQLMRRYCYHPLFHGSFSIKSVLPALVPDLDYTDLDINDGMMASLAFAEMRRPETDSERRRFLREGLRSYCKRDTEAEVRLYQMLKERLPS